MSPVFEPVEHALYDVSSFVEIGVVFELDLSVFAGWDAGVCIGFIQPLS